jgi:hypothetical protein
LSIGAFNALAVTGDDHAAAHEQSARQLLRRFRRRRSFYPTLISSWLVHNRGVAPTLAPTQAPKRKFAYYRYRFHTLRVVRVDKEAMVITIKKIEDAARKLPNENISVHQAAAAKVAPATPVAPAVPRPPRPPTVPKDRLASVVMLDCPLCSKPCLDMLGILRHYAKSHFGLVKPSQQELEELREKQVERNKQMAEKNGSEDVASTVATPSATPTPSSAAAPNNKRKRAATSEDNAAASDAIKTLAVAATIGEPDDSVTSPTPRGGKRSRATPSPSPTPPSISALAAAADSFGDEDAEMAEAMAASPMVPLSGGSAASRSRPSNASPSAAPIKPFKLPLKGAAAAQPKSTNGTASPQTNSNSTNKRKRDDPAAETDDIVPPTSKQRRSSPNEASSTAGAAPSPSPTPSTTSTTVKKKPRNELEMLLQD